MNCKAALVILSAGLLLLQGCAVEEYNSTNSPKMIVSADHTPFYRNGPAQGNGPDFSLNKGESVEVLRKEIGYSFVRLLEGDNGYVANEALTAVTSSPSATPANKPVTRQPPSTNSPSTNAIAKPGFRY
jgi:uncharacterized protein YgiM (DUF1202 family)